MPLRHGNAWEYMNNAKPKCPHCDADFDVAENEAWSLYEEGTKDVKCPACRKSFTVCVSCTFSYDTESPGGKE